MVTIMLYLSPYPVICMQDLIITYELKVCDDGIIIHLLIFLTLSIVLFFT
jgi:hypothetical protein